MARPPHAYTEFDSNDTLPTVIATRAGRTPDRVYVHDVTNGRTLTFGAAHDLILTWADAFDQAGVRPGDRVAVMLPNSFEAAAAWLGCGWLRALEVPLNNALRGEMLRYMLTNSGASFAVVAERFLERFEEVAGDISLASVVVPDATAAHRPLGGRIPVLSGPEFLAGAAPARDLAPPMPWDVAGINYTSGTTGPSKGVVTPWGELILGVTLLDDLGPDDVMYSPFPMFHMSGKGGLLQAAFMGGRTVIREAFDTGSFWADIDACGCTFTLMVPAMVHWLMAQEPSPADTSHALRHVLNSPVVPGFGERFGVKVRTHYGMTEVGNVMSRRAVTDRSPSCGRPLPGYEVRLVDEHDYEVPVGEVGELAVRTDQPWWICLGYWEMPEKTAEAWRNGWFHTGDGMRRDDDGNYFFVDRQKDALRRRGENVSSFEVEALVNQHPEVSECAAIGVDTELGEQEIKVCIVLRAAGSVTPEALLAFLIPRMPRYMVPRYVEFVDSLPKTEATLRVRKAVLRESPLNERTWDREAAGIVVPR